MPHFYLSDAQWEAIKPHLPPDWGRKRRVGDRRVSRKLGHDGKYVTFEKVSIEKHDTLNQPQKTKPG